MAGEDVESSSVTNDSYTLLPMDVSFASHPHRWAILAIFCALSMMTAVVWLTFAPAASLFSLYFDDIGATAINMLSLIFLILFPFGSLLGAYCSSKYGLRTTALLGGSLTLLSCLVRYVVILAYAASALNATQAYALVLIGQSIGALSQPLFLNAPGMLASHWFAVKERDLATTIGAMANPVGNAVASVLTPALVFQRGDDDNSAVLGVPLLMLVQTIMAAASLIAAFFFFQRDPPTPPSRSAALREADANAKHSTPTQQFLAEMGIMMKDRDFLLLFSSFSAGLGFINALLTLTEQIVEPYGYSTGDAGWMGALLMVGGLVGAGATGAVLDKTHAYRTALKASFFASAIAALGLVLALRKNNLVTLLIVYGFLGACCFSVLPCAIQNAAECTYPIDEDKSTGLLFTGGNIVGIPFTLVLQPLCRMEKWWGPFSGFSTCLLSVLVSTSFILSFYNGEYKRLQTEEPDNSLPSELLSENSAIFNCAH